MTDAPAIDETEDEVDVILSFLEAERTDEHTKLAVHERALLRLAAILLASGDASKARDVSDLLTRAPAIIRRGARPVPTMAQLSKPDRPWDLELLSNEQLGQFENIAAVAQQRACAVPDPRTENALWLALHVGAVSGGKAKRDEAGVKKLVEAILSPMYAVEELWPSRSAELIAAQERRIEVERELERLRAALAELPTNVVRMRPSAAGASSPMAGPPGARGHVGDYPGA
jgi:hypothetical protein